MVIMPFCKTVFPSVVISTTNDPKGQASSFNPNDLLTGRVSPIVSPGAIVCVGTNAAKTIEACSR